MGNVPTDRLFTGQRLDATGLYYYNARYYDATIGRFISADTFVQWSIGSNCVSQSMTVNSIPIVTLDFLDLSPSYTKQPPVSSRTFNRYSYVNNNPLKYTDQTGQWTAMLALSTQISFLLGGSHGLGIIIDGYGNWAIISTTTTTITFTSGVNIGAELSITGGVQLTDADTIWDVLNTPYETQYSLSAGDGVAVSFTGIFGDKYEGIGLSAGLGAGISLCGSVEVDTQVLLSSKSVEYVNEPNFSAFGLFITGELSFNAYFTYLYYTCYMHWDPLFTLAWVLIESSV